MIRDLLDLLGGFGTPGLCLLVALLAFAETAMFLDLVVPGEVGMVVVGAAAAQSSSPLLAIIAAGVLGAMAGDCVSYTVGRRWGRVAVERFRFTRERLGPAVDRAERYFARHGGWAVFVGRWIGALRAVVPFVAGVGRLRFPSFLAWNALASVTWVATVLGLGYLFGRRMADLVDRFQLVLLGLVAIAAVVWLVRRRSRNAPHERTGNPV